MHLKHSNRNAYTQNMFKNMKRKSGEFMAKLTPLINQDMKNYTIQKELF